MTVSLVAVDEAVLEELVTVAHALGGGRVAGPAAPARFPAVLPDGEITALRDPLPDD